MNKCAECENPTKCDNYAMLRPTKAAQSTNPYGFSSEEIRKLAFECYIDTVERTPMENVFGDMSKLSPSVLMRLNPQRSQALAKSRMPLSNFAKGPVQVRDGGKETWYTTFSEMAKHSPDGYLAKSYRFLEKEYKQRGSLAEAMRTAYDLFSDECTPENKTLIEKAIAALDVTNFLDLLSRAMQKASL